ncbi:hypothetical protein FBB35_21485 [Nostoc sp. TCL240-02]|nr:hypothetical protein FBB35_21485 [Nostoc sp. TCL240-02]
MIFKITFVVRAIGKPYVQGYANASSLMPKNPFTGMAHPTPLHLHELPLAPEYISYQKMINKT